MTLRPSLLLRREGVALLAGVLLLGILAHLSRGTSLTDIRVENRWGTHAVQEKCLPKETNTPLSPLIDLDDGVRTEIVHHAPGFTLFDNLLVFNGTVYIVSDDQQTIPQIRLMTSTGYILVNDPVEIAKREPTSKDMQVISSQEAAKLFGRKVVAVEGVTFLVNDPSQCEQTTI
ncbi:hypothetical protein FRC03_005479 [Tulasnella sp. 419]|nr:hypothetical protein FRC03_005479 [Tulasnella sp. 419]